VVESGILTETGDRYAVTGPVAPLATPTSLHASLLARLDRLAPTREVSQIAAALGRQFSRELISAVATLPKQQLDDALAQLVRAELVFRRGTPPDAEYTFKHALVQDAAYGTLLRSRRQRLHTRIVTTLEDRFPEILLAQPALLAQHCSAAGQAEQAVVYWLKAGQQALARSAATEAAAQLRKGLDVLAGLPDSPWRRQQELAVTQLRKGLDVLADLPDSPWRRQQELDLQIALGSALAATRGIAADDVGATITRKQALAEQLDRPQYLVQLLFDQWRFRSVRSEHKLALPYAEELEKIGEARNDGTAQLLGHRAHGQTRCYLGEFVTAQVRLELCLPLSDPAHRSVGELSDDPYATMLTYLGVTLAHLGYIEQARSRVDEALSEARRLKHAITLATVLLWAIWMEVITGSSEMEGHVEELLSLSTERGFSFHLAYATVNRGRYLIARGQAQAGLALMTRGLTAIRATGALVTTPIMLMWVAEAHTLLGQPGEGLACLAEAARTIETTDERCHEAELHRLRGDFLHAAGDLSTSELSYHQSLEVARSQSAKLLELRVSTRLARLWRDQGRRAEARDLLGPIYNWFTEGFDAPDLKDARTLLDALA
jgi:hypothetical protein